MKKNLSRVEAILRLLVGSFLFYLFIVGGPTWTLLGLYLMLTGSFRFCLIFYYLSFKI
jgi:hypothetical protein